MVALGLGLIGSWATWLAFRTCGIPWRFLDILDERIANPGVHIIVLYCTILYYTILLYNTAVIL